METPKKLMQLHIFFALLMKDPLTDIPPYLCYYVRFCQCFLYCCYVVNKSQKRRYCHFLFSPSQQRVCDSLLHSLPKILVRSLAYSLHPSILASSRNIRETKSDRTWLLQCFAVLKSLRTKRLHRLLSPIIIKLPYKQYQTILTNQNFWVKRADNS